MEMTSVANRLKIDEARTLQRYPNVLPLYERSLVRLREMTESVMMR
jgi:hypothetical protein